MAYQPLKPNRLGTFYLNDIDLKEIVPFIDWRFYFLAWRISGRYDGIENVHGCQSCEAEWLLRFDVKDRPKAEEALQLLNDAREMLHYILENKSIKLNAVYSLLPAYSKEDDIIIEADDKTVTIPMLRQQKPSADGFCYSLADFLAPENDYIGVFANTVTGTEEMATIFEQENDIYKAILIKTLSDRLGEATAEWLHWKVRKEYWGYAPDENLTVEDILRTRYKGIRPAVGYPSLPDQSVIFDLEPLLNFEKTGISLTENGAMFPNASVCGFYFAHPESKYFMIGKIDEEQLANYATRKGKSLQDIGKWLTSNI